MSDSEQCSNRLEFDLISLLVNFSCELGQRMTRYDFLWARWVIMSNVRTILVPSYVWANDNDIFQLGCALWQRVFWNNDLFGVVKFYEGGGGGGYCNYEKHTSNIFLFLYCSSNIILAFFGCHSLQHCILRRACFNRCKINLDLFKCD